MTIKKQLKRLLEYSSRTRQVGHTTAMIRGAQNVDAALVLVADRPGVVGMKSKLAGATGVSVVALEDIEPRITGLIKPMLIDNSALFSLLSDAIKEIESLEGEVEELTKALQS